MSQAIHDCLLNGGCRWPTILELWNKSCVNTHCPLLFQSSKINYSLGMCHPTRCTRAYKINVPGHPCTIWPTCRHQWSNILCSMCLTCRGQQPTLLKLWNGNCVNAHAPSLFQVPTHIVVLDWCPSLLHMCMWLNVLGHPVTVCSLCCCWLPTISERLNFDGLTTHAPSPFYLFKMYSRW